MTYSELKVEFEVLMGEEKLRPDFDNRMRLLMIAMEQLKAIKE